MGHSAVPELSLSENILLSQFPKNNFIKNGIILKNNVDDFANNVINEFKINPKDADLKICDFSEILGGSPNFNAQKIEYLVDGEKNGFFQSVVFNSAAALTISEKVKTLKDGALLASDALLSGKTRKLIENLKTSKTSLS